MEAADGKPEPKRKRIIVIEDEDEDVGEKENITMGTEIKFIRTEAEFIRTLVLMM